jgi:hypothetical protein
VELFWVSRCIGTLWLRKDLTQFHKHFSREGGKEPEYWTNNVERFDRQDMLLFMLRSCQRFPGCEPLDAPGLTRRRYDHAVFEEHYTGKAEALFTTKFDVGVYANSCVGRFRRALERCAKAGRRAVGVYGAGAHTGSMARVLKAPPCPVACIIDDNPQLSGKSLWNFPILSREQALHRGVDAVVLSSDSMEHLLWNNAQPFRDRGIDVIRLYEPQMTQGRSDCKASEAVARLQVA